MRTLPVADRASVVLSHLGFGGGREPPGPVSKWSCGCISPCWDRSLARRTGGYADPRRGDAPADRTGAQGYSSKRRAKLRPRNQRKAQASLPLDHFGRRNPLTMARSRST
jgi:hypothetical protein